MNNQLVEFVVVGAGPAGVCAIAKLYASNIPGDQLVWIDPAFQVGDFGTKLSVGTAVPGNTTVESYQRVNHGIYSLIPTCAPTDEISNNFELNSIAAESTCALNIATKPLQHITDKLRQLVTSIQGTVINIQEMNDWLQIAVKNTDGTIKQLSAKRVILATGAIPKTLALPDHVSAIDPNIAFIESELALYLKENPEVKQVAVVGSSHSAALAVMHLLQAGKQVMQFMNKEYKFAAPAIAADGTRYTQFDNTGLKGKVAAFTRQLLSNTDMQKNWQCHIGENINALIREHLPKCTHAVVCIGYAANSTLHINGLPLSKFKHDKHTTQIMTADGKPVSGLFGIGVAFPPEVKAISGEIEAAVGVGKFWTYINDKVLKQWELSIAVYA